MFGKVLVMMNCFLQNKHHDAEALKQVHDMKYSLPSVQLFCNHSYLTRVHGLHQTHQREDNITKTYHESHRRSSSGPGRCECVCTCQIFRCSFESYSE